MGMGRGTGETVAADLDGISEVAGTAGAAWDGPSMAARRRAAS
jgi:hypothetical protein